MHALRLLVRLMILIVTFVQCAKKEKVPLKDTKTQREDTYHVHTTCDRNRNKVHDVSYGFST